MFVGGDDESGFAISGLQTLALSRDFMLSAGLLALTVDVTVCSFLGEAKIEGLEVVLGAGLVWLEGVAKVPKFANENLLRIKLKIN